MDIANRRIIGSIYVYLSWFMASVFVARILWPDLLSSNPDLFRGLDTSEGNSFRHTVEAIFVISGAVCVSLKERISRDVKLILVGSFMAIFFFGWFFISASFGIAFGIFCKAIVSSIPNSYAPNKSSHSAN